MIDRSLVSLLRRTFWISIAAIGAVAITVIGVAIMQRGRDRFSQHSREVVAMARRAELLALDRETGCAGFC